MLGVSSTPRFSLQSSWMAATALVHRAQVWTQDRDFAPFGSVDIVRLSGSEASAAEPGHCPAQEEVVQALLELQSA